MNKISFTHKFLYIYSLLWCLIILIVMLNFPFMDQFDYLIEVYNSNLQFRSDFISWTYIYLFFTLFDYGINYLCYPVVFLLLLSCINRNEQVSLLLIFSGVDLLSQPRNFFLILILLAFKNQNNLYIKIILILSSLLVHYSIFIFPLSPFLLFVDWEIISYISSINLLDFYSIKYNSLINAGLDSEKNLFKSISNPLFLISILCSFILLKLKKYVLLIILFSWSLLYIFYPEYGIISHRSLQLTISIFLIFVFNKSIQGYKQFVYIIILYNFINTFNYINIIT